MRGRKAALSWKNSIKKFFGKKSNWPQKPHDKEEQSYLVWTFLECYAIINPPASKIKDFERGPDSLNCALLCFTAALKEEASWRLRLCGIIFLRRRPKQSFGRLREHWTMALLCFTAALKEEASWRLRLSWYHERTKGRAFAATASARCALTTWYHKCTA